MATSLFFLGFLLIHPHTQEIFSFITGTHNLEGAIRKVARIATIVLTLFNLLGIGGVCVPIKVGLY